MKLAFFITLFCVGLFTLQSCGDDPEVCGCSDDKSTFKSQNGSADSTKNISESIDKWVYNTNECYVFNSEEPAAVGCCKVYKNCEYFQQVEIIKNQEFGPPDPDLIQKSGNKEVWYYMSRNAKIDFTTSSTSDFCCEYNITSF